MGYSKEKLQELIEQAANNIGNFYNAECVNYSGRTNDTGELYTELIAQWCADNIGLFDAIPVISRRASYKSDSHNGLPLELADPPKEEHIAKALFRQKPVVPGLGTILDYQTPLRDEGHGGSRAIDLLAYDGQELWILELKKKDNDETMLRAVLEGYTYLKKVDQAKLLRDFELPPNTKVSASPLVFVGSAQYKEMLEDRPCLHKLMDLLDARPFFLSQTEDGQYVAQQ